jgi:hypothetical protein
MLVLDAKGEPVDRPTMMNLALFRDKGGDDNSYEVKGLVKPEHYGIDVAGYILREMAA